MKLSRTMLGIIVIAIAAILAATIWFQKDFPAVAFGALLVCVLADGLLEGEISFGQRNAKRRIKKTEHPVAYWSVVGLYFSLIFALVLVVRKGEDRPRPITRADHSTIEAPVGDKGDVSTQSDDRGPTTLSENARTLSQQELQTAAQEEVEAMRRGDVAAVARSIVLTGEAKAVLEATLASVPPELAHQYPTPELLAAFVFCGAQRIEGFRIESTTFERSDYATQQVAYKFASEAGWRTEKIAFARMPDGWHRVIDVGLAERVAAIVAVRK